MANKNEKYKIKHLPKQSQPAELVGVYVFRASDEPSHITGESIKVTGGL